MNLFDPPPGLLRRLLRRLRWWPTRAERAHEIRSWQWSEPTPRPKPYDWQREP